MEKIITLDKNIRIKIIAENFMFEYKIKTKNKRIKWHTDGFFPNLESLYEDYINNALYLTIQATENLKKLVETMKTAKLNLRKAIEKNMRKIIPIDKDARIRITPRNHTLQYRIKTGNKRILWGKNGYFSDLKSLSKEYLNDAPYRSTQIIDDPEKLTKIIKIAESNFCKAIKKIDQ